MHPLRAGLIGFGAIGRGVLEAARRGDAGDTRFDALLVRDARRLPPAVAEGRGLRVFEDAAGFLGSSIEIAVEAAGAAAVRQHGEAVLQAGVDLMLASVGALSDAALLQRLSKAAERTGRRVLIPSGAIAGLDAIAAAALGEVDEVVHTTRKPPRAFTPEQLGPEPLHAPRVLYDGPAREGVARFPENVNVAAAVSLAGVGLDRTRLCVVADPDAARNTHTVVVRGYFGQLEIRIENIPSENPKTGRLVPLSIAKALRNLSSPIVVGV